MTKNSKKKWIGLKCLWCGFVLPKGDCDKPCPVCGHDYGVYAYEEEKEEQPN